MHLYGDLPPVLSGVHDQIGRRVRKHEVMHALTVDLNRARLDFARGVRDRLREAGLGEQLVDPNAGGGGFTAGCSVSFSRRSSWRTSAGRWPRARPTSHSATQISSTAPATPSPSSKPSTRSGHG